MPNEQFVPLKKNGKGVEPLAQKSVKERKLRHKSRSEKLKALPRVRKAGRSMISMMNELGLTGSDENLA